MYRAIRPNSFSPRYSVSRCWLCPALSLAQYKKTNLVSNLATGAKHQDTQLQNAWGLAYAPAIPLDQRRVQWAFDPV